MAPRPAVSGCEEAREPVPWSGRPSTPSPSCEGRPAAGTEGGGAGPGPARGKQRRSRTVALAGVVTEVTQGVVEAAEQGDWRDRLSGWRVLSRKDE